MTKLLLEHGAVPQLSSAHSSRVPPTRRDLAPADEPLIPDRGALRASAHSLCSFPTMPPSLCHPEHSTES
jgi:hypothetical protein